MFNIKKAMALLGTSLLLMQGLPFAGLKGNEAGAATYSSAMQELMSRPRPIIIANQWHTTPEGTFSAGNYEGKIEFIAKHLDYVTLNRAGGNMNDLFLDFYESTHDPSRGLLKIRNDIYAAASAEGRRVYVMPYHNMSDVWYYQSNEHFPNQNFWMKPDGENKGTWDYMNDHDYWYKGSTGIIVAYPGYSNSQRRFWDSSRKEVQEYWAQHAKGITDQGFDGIFADNWLRSGFSGNNRGGIQQGWNETGQRFKEIAPDKILIGNSPPYGAFTSRDVCMLEDRIAPAFSGDKSVPSYLEYSDQAAQMNQVCQDTYWDEAQGDFKTFRLPMALLTDNIIGISTVTRQGTAVETMLMPYIEKLGKLGQPTGPRYMADGVLQRDYTEGKVIFNDTAESKTVSVPSGTYATVEGQDVSNVTLGSLKGIVLKTKNASPPTDPPVDPPADPPTDPPTAYVPNAPSNVTINSIAVGSQTGNHYVNLTWKDNSNIETGFEILHSVNDGEYKLVKTPKANAQKYGVNIGNSVENGYHSFKVIAVNENGKSDDSNIATKLIGDPPPPPVPTAPSDMKVDGVAIGSKTGYYYVNVSWTDNSDDETGFEILQSINDGEYKVVKTPAANGTKYGINIGKNPTQGYYNYKIVAVNENGKSDPSNVATAEINLPKPPAAPTGLTGSIGSSTTGEKVVVLKLTDNSDDEEGFNIYVNNVKAGSVGADETTIVHTAITGSYEITAKAFNSAGESDESNKITVTVN